MNVARYIAFASLCLLGGGLVLVGLGCLDRPVTDQEVELFMRTNRWVDWSSKKQIVAREELYPALYQWRRDTGARDAKFLIGAGVVALLAGSFLSFTDRAPIKK